MAVSYKKLFHMMVEKEMTNSQLQQQAGFSGNIITRLKRNCYVSLESIESISHCNIYEGFCSIQVFISLAATL